MVASISLTRWRILLNFLMAIVICAWGIAGAAPPRHDSKGSLLVVVMSAETDASRESLAAVVGERLSAVDPDARVQVLPAGDARKSAEAILSLPESDRNALGALVFLESPAADAKEPAASVEIYHYPIDPIASEHVVSPEYSFKFGSDSALLSIHLKDQLTTHTMGVGGGEPVVAALEIRPATDANLYLPREILRKSVRLRIPEVVLSGDSSLGSAAGCVAEAFARFRSDNGSYVMGVLSDRARRHIPIENAEVRVSKYVYPDKESTTEEKAARDRTMAEVVTAARPNAAGLYVVSGLEPLAPYTLRVTDLSTTESAFWHVADEPRVVTSSMGGVVRTVPGLLKSYAPLENRYSAKEESGPVPAEYDYIIEGALVFDGTRNGQRRMADVGIVGERIANVGNLEGKSRTTTIDGRGRYLTPGFIDIHSHADSDIFDVPYAPSHVRQGITTVLGGNCSFSPLGIASYLDQVQEKGAGINIGVLIGNRPVRERVLGRRKGMFPYDELYRQKELVDLAMEEGAFGMATGLIYSISEEAFAWELAELAKQLKPYGGFYASHIRGESDEVLDAVREAIYIGELAEVPVQISHMKVLGKQNWGDMKQYLEIMKEARARKLDVTGDQYPWRASGPAGHYTLHRLVVREGIRNESPEVVLLKDMPGRFEKYSGRPLSELLEQENMTAEQFLQELNVTADTKLYATYLVISPDDLLLPMKEDWVMVCTDSGLVSLEDIEGGKVWDSHPRTFRSYPEYFARYVRDKGVSSWELAVYKCTGLPAWRMKLKDRGVIRRGAYADLVLLDPKGLDPGADYRDQAPPPKGIEWVFVNGQPAVKGGELARIQAGKPLFAYGNRKP